MQEHTVLSVVRPEAGEWSGLLEVDLRNARDWSIGTLRMELEAGAVRIWFGSRILAEMERDRLREWIIHPRGTRFAADGLVWSVQYGSTYVAIDRVCEYRIADASIRALTAVI